MEKTFQKMPIDREQVQVTMNVISQYTRQIRAAAAAVAFLAILDPWAPLGTDGSMNGGQLLAHVFTGGETLAWMTSGNVLGFILMVSLPIYMLPLLLMTLIGHLQGKHTPISNIIILIAPPITMAAATYPMLDETPQRILGLAMPLWGLQLVMLAHLGLLVHTAYADVRHRWRYARAQQQGKKIAVQSMEESEE